MREVPPSPNGASQEKDTMKRAIQWMIVVVGLVGASLTVATPLIFADGGPIPMCNPATPERCSKGGGK